MGSDSAETSSNIGKDKSFVYDLNMERGTVSMRVASVPRSAEVKPSVPVICIFISPSANSRWGSAKEERERTDEGVCDRKEM